MTAGSGECCGACIEPMLGIISLSHRAGTSIEQDQVKFDRLPQKRLQIDVTCALLLRARSNDVAYV
jgi:hypothetical protein